LLELDKSDGFSSLIPEVSSRGITVKKERQPPQSMESGGATAPHRSKRGIPQANNGQLEHFLKTSIQHPITRRSYSTFQVDWRLTAGKETKDAMSSL